MKILVVAGSTRDAVNIVRMIRPDAIEVATGRWRANGVEYLAATLGGVFGERGFDRAVVFFGGDADPRLMTWVQQIVAPKMGGRGTELVVIG